jgi:hypothetical protein
MLHFWVDMSFVALPATVSHPPSQW